MCTSYEAHEYINSKIQRTGLSCYVTETMGCTTMEFIQP